MTTGGNPEHSDELFSSILARWGAAVSRIFTCAAAAIGFILMYLWEKIPGCFVFGRNWDLQGQRKELQLE